ncbi:MAG: NUDIX domain-containing protein [Alphaproteobacteria bacterium]|nr:NUDIX domain-containing protein [Alphaproteobacteria bacterium]
MVRTLGGMPQFLLAHPGGPFFAKKDAGHWSIPKGLVEPGEAVLDAAIREFREETGWEPTGPYQPLDFVDQRRKRVHAWAFEGDADPATLRSNPVEIEWPPRSGRRVRFPEIDRAAWFDPIAATAMILPAQQPFLLRAMAWLAARG